ncbi:MAG: peroxidase-related enzyme [bacterium]|nr:peroxidase-related enzyme [bacterium]
MTWIKIADLSAANQAWTEAFDRQNRLYPEEYDRQIPGLPPFEEGIVAAHSLIPKAMEHAFSTLGSLLSPDLPLTRKQHELIATAVSEANCTRYCSAVHREFLRHVSGANDKTADAQSAQLAPSHAADSTATTTEAEQTMIAYALQVTKDAAAIKPSWHDRLRSVGFDDTGILQITMIAAWFNYVNRVADALGVGRDA